MAYTNKSINYGNDDGVLYVKKMLNDIFKDCIKPYDINKTLRMRYKINHRSYME